MAAKYEYDRAGRLTQISDNRRGGLLYEYDPVGRLLSAYQRGLGTERFAFDPASNIQVPEAPSGVPPEKSSRH